MNEKKSQFVKNQSPYYYLVIGIIWLALGSFGLFFDPTKITMIICQFIVGGVILSYYFWIKYK